MTTFSYAGVEYTEKNITPMVNYLVVRVEALQAYQETTLKTITDLLAARDYRSAIETFTLMCKVLAAARRIHGEKVLE